MFLYCQEVPLCFKWREMKFLVLQKKKLRQFWTEVFIINLFLQPGLEAVLYQINLSDSVYSLQLFIFIYYQISAKVLSSKLYSTKNDLFLFYTMINIDLSENNLQFLELTGFVYNNNYAKLLSWTCQKPTVIHAKLFILL